jgi:Predicted nucleotide-binding protein containing TIR-like domain
MVLLPDQGLQITMSDMKPSMFVGSSRESLQIAYTIQENLEHAVEVTVWPQGIFRLSDSTLDSLIETLDRFDFGVFVLSADDIALIREEKHSVTRDNVVFELGLFIGRLGKKRNFLVMPRGSNDFRLPTDLLGMTPATFDPNRKDGNLAAALGPACNKIASEVRRLGLANKTSNGKTSAGEDLPAKSGGPASVAESRNATAYPMLRNDELRAKTLEFVQILRALIEKANRKDQKLTTARPATKGMSDVELNNHPQYQEYIRSLSLAKAQLELEYNRKYKVEAILLRDELLVRLQAFSSPRDEMDQWYVNAGSSFILEKIAVDLEYLARLLPST